MRDDWLAGLHRAAESESAQEVAALVAEVDCVGAMVGAMDAKSGNQGSAHRDCAGVG